MVDVIALILTFFCPAIFKICFRITNRVDLDQTAPWSSLIQVYTVCIVNSIPIFLDVTAYGVGGS